MKKNKMMRIASVLLVAVLFSTCAISGTFAKYVSSATSQDNARVAVWGINAGATTMDLFDSSYANVNANDGDNLIAPGTSKTSNFQIINASAIAPEVAYQVKIDLAGSEIDTSIQNNPNIQWKLDSGEWGTWDALLASIRALSGNASGTKDYAPGEIATEFETGKVHSISWQWIFSTSDVQDAADTAMGNAAATGDLNVKLVVKITATQID